MKRISSQGVPKKCTICREDADSVSHRVPTKPIADHGFRLRDGLRRGRHGPARSLQSLRSRGHSRQDGEDDMGRSGTSPRAADAPTCDETQCVRRRDPVFGCVSFRSSGRRPALSCRPNRVSSTGRRSRHGLRTGRGRSSPRRSHRSLRPTGPPARALHPLACP